MSTRTSRVVWDLIARDNASRTFARVSGAAAGLNRTGAGVGAALKRSFAIGSVAVAGLGYSVLSAAGDFEKAMNRVEALSGASGKSLEKLRDQAKDLGTSTQYSATQTADAMGALATAGLNVNQIYGAMPSVLNLASSENLNLERSAEITTSVMTGYGMAVSQIPHAVDAMVKASVKANTSVDDIGEAFKYAGPIAHQAGLQFEETVASMALMGNAGIKASMAGTALRGAVTRLLAPTKQIQETLDKLGVSVRTADGHLLPLTQIVDELGKKGATTGDIMTIFGQRAGPGMAALIQQGSAKLAGLTKELENSGGTAERISKIQMKGYRGELTRLKNAWSGLMIEIGDTGVLSIATTALSGVTKSVRGFADFVNDTGIPAAKHFGQQIGSMIPVDRIKSAVSGAKTVIGDFLKGLGLGDAGGTAKSPLDKFPTTILQRLGGAPHLGSGQSSSTAGAGQALQQMPHYGVGQVAPTTGVQGAPLAPQPHGGSGLTAPLITPKLKAPKSAAQQLGETIRKAVSDGITGIDWGKLGSSLGKGLGAAIGWIGQHAAELTGKLGSALAKIDWVDVGKSVGGQAIPFAIGFIFNLFEPLFSLDFWKKHWLDTIIAVLSVIPIGRIAGALGKVVGKIPVFKIFEPLFSGISKLGGFIEKGLSRFVLKPLGRFGKAVWDGIVSGFTKVFPGAAGKLAGFIEKLALGIVGYGGRFVGAGERLIKGLGEGALKAGGKIGEWTGQIIGKIVKPFADAGSWLWSKGAAIVSGLKNGVVSGSRNITLWVYNTLIRPSVDAFRGAGSWLWSKGVAIVTGLKNGVVNGARAIGGWAWRTFGRPVVDAFQNTGSWLWSKGSALVGGLKNGVVSGSRAIGGWAWRTFGKPVVDAFKFAGSWLLDKGSALINGMKNGIVNAVKGIGKWIKSHLIDPVVNAVKNFFGIHSPSTVFAEIGGHLVAGLFKGLATTSGSAIAKKVFGDLPHALSSIVGKGLVAVKGLPKKAVDALGGIGGTITGVSPGAGGAMALGQQMALNNFGWSGDQWNALKQLWTGESGWNYKATNPSSGAYGIPQALPASKMASAGPDWRTNPGTQILWGLRYIKSRYGTPANAYRQWLSRSPHWYDAGGVAQGKGYMAKNTIKPERVLSPRQTEAFEEWMRNGGSGAVDVHVHFNDDRLRDLIDVRVTPKIKASEQQQAHRAKVGRRG